MSKKLRELLGAELRALREAAGINPADLAKKLGTSRAGIYEIEAGQKNFTVDQFDKLLRACGLSAERLLAGLSKSDLPYADQDFYRMLRIILESGDPDLRHGIRVNLDAISDKALRLKNRGSSAQWTAASGTAPGGEAGQGKWPRAQDAPFKLIDITSIVAVESRAPHLRPIEISRFLRNKYDEDTGLAVVDHLAACEPCSIIAMEWIAVAHN
jgi:transcriptional regulator with XRE-family HTH domain